MSNSFCSTKNLLAGERFGFLAHEKMCTPNMSNINKNQYLAFSLAEGLPKEVFGIIKSFYVLSSTHPRDTNEKMRSILIDWMMQVHKMFKLLAATWSLAVSILDAYLIRTPELPRTKLQLVGIASVFLASKFSEIYPPEVKDCVYISDNFYTKDQILDMEKLIFITLGCNINLPQDMSYVRRLSGLELSSLDCHTLTKELVRMACIDVKLNKWLLSVIVTAAKKIAAKLCGEPFMNSFGVPNGVISAAAAQLVSLAVRLGKSSLKAFEGTMNKSTKSLWAAYKSSILTYVDDCAPAEDEKYTRAFYYKPNLALNLLPNSAVPAGSPKLGEGTYGVVKKVCYNGVWYAVKKFRDLDSEEGLSSSFLREVSVFLSLRHENIIKILYITENLKNIFLPLGASDLKGWCQKHPLSVTQKERLTTQMIKTLVYLQGMGCLHRDIKTQNIIVFDRVTEPKANIEKRLVELKKKATEKVTEEIKIEINKELVILAAEKVALENSVRDGTHLDFVLCDFGLVRGSKIPIRGIPFTHEVCTLWYRPPEILLGATSYDDGADVWSMVCTIYEACTGKALFPGDSEIDQLYKIFQLLGTPTEEMWTGVTALPEYKTTFPLWKNKLASFLVNKAIPPKIAKVIEMGLTYEPGKRPLANDLLAFLKGLTLDKVTQEEMDEYVSMGTAVGVVTKDGSKVVVNERINMEEVLHLDKYTHYDVLRATEGFDEKEEKWLFKYLKNKENIKELSEEVKEKRGL